MSRLVRIVQDDLAESVGLPCHTPVVFDAGTAMVRRLRPDEAPEAPVLAPQAAGHVLLTPPGRAQVRGLPPMAGTCCVVNGDAIEAAGSVWRYLTHDFLDPERTEPLWLPDGVAGGLILCAACVDDDAPLSAGELVVYCPSCRWAFHPDCLQRAGLAACPVCSCSICRTDHERESFLLQAHEGWRQS